MILTKQELLNITGGAVTATLINAFAKGISTLLELGRNFGSAIRRVSTGKLCSF